MNERTGWNTRRLSTLQGGLASVILPITLVGQAAEQNPANAPSVETKKSPWSWNAGVGVKETFDSNVYLQDVSSLANKESFVTTLSASAGLSYQPCDEFHVSLQYSPDVSFFHSESSEDHSVHRVGLNLDGKAGPGNWKWLNSLTVIDGEDQGVVFTTPGFPAAGGIPIRNRRDATILMNSISYRQPIGDWFLRPNFNVYVHDFQTKHMANPPGGYYLNYVDRNDISGGVDVGYTFAENTALVMGYQIGHQTQATLMDFPEEYSNFYQRVLVGIEGKPTEWLDLNLSAGPDFRAFGQNTHDGFNSNMTVIFIKGAATIKPSKKDAVQLSIHQYMQPGFGGRGIYEDITYTASWKHSWTDQLSSTLKFNAYSVAFVPRAGRIDWIYTPSAAVTYNIMKGLTAELAYSYDWSESRIPNIPAREFTRHLVSLGATYKF